MNIEMITMSDAAKVLDKLTTKSFGGLGKPKRPSDDQVNRAIESLTADLFDGVMVCIDPKEHKITKINDPYCVLSGGYGDSVIDQELAEMLPANKRAAVRKLFQKLFDSRKKRPAVEITIPFGIDEAKAENVRARVYCNEQSIVMLVDKSQLVNLQEIEVIRIKALVSRSENAGFWVTDKDGIIKDVCELGASFHLGYTEKELVGMNIRTYIKDGQNIPLLGEGSAPMKIERVASDGEPVECEVVQKKITMSNGEDYILHLDTYTGKSSSAFA